MKIYTSYFGVINRLPTDILPISICGKAPDWYKGAQYKALAPKYGFFQEWKKNHDNNYYIEHFKEEVLDRISVENVLRDLERIAGDFDEIALICYERPEDFCHRHIVADWFVRNGINVQEYKFHKS